MSLQKTSELDEFYKELSWNHVFYGALLEDGTYVWSNSITDVINYAGRAKGDVVKSCWGKVRERLLEINETNESDTN